MKKLYAVALLLALISLSPIEYDRALILRVENLMKTSPTTKSYTYQGNGWFEFKDENGLKWHRNFGDTRTHGGLKPKKIISIDLRKIDTTGFSTMFTELSTVHIGNASDPPIGSHLGIDSLAELMGQYYEQGWGDYVWLARQRKGSYDFDRYLRIENKYTSFGVSDIDLNGIQELLGDSLGSILTFEASAPGALDLKLKHFWSGKTGSAQVPRINDFDGDGYPEITMHQFGDGFHGTRIVKYKQDSKKLERVFQIRYPNNPGFRGYWAVGDFDKDGKNEFVTANYNGEVFFVEHVQGDTSYAISFSDTTRYINAFFHTEGNDLDGDGRPECFIGSDNTGGLNNIAVYETIGDNKFEVSVWIEIYPVGSFIWEWIWTGDVTGDGRDEIVLTSGNALIILKAVANDEYKVIWYKRYNSKISHRLFDVDLDGKQEILLSFIDADGLHKTKILSYNIPTSVQKLKHLHPLTISVFPNPATTQATIGIETEQKESNHLVVTSIAGKVILEKDIVSTPAEVIILPLPVQRFPEGVYFITMTNSKTSITIKFLVLH